MSLFASPILSQSDLTKSSSTTIERALQTVREHLGMDIAYLSEFVDGRSVFRALNAPGLEEVVKVGDSNSLEDVYCNHILEGRLPALMPDTSLEPVAMALPITTATPIGAHMSLPVTRPDGSVYGMFCCLATKPNRNLNERDLETMRIFASLATEQVHRDEENEQVRREKVARIETALNGATYSVVYQPIWNLRSKTIAGFESLCRFDSDPYRTPDLWFADAADVGLGIELELAVIATALAMLPNLDPALYLSVNASPETVTSGRLVPLLAGLPGGRIVIEITEHAQVADYDHLLACFQPLKEMGVRLAVDDAGAGYSSLRHIVRLSPDIIKLDMSLTRDVDTNPAHRSLANALIYFSNETNAAIVAEGIETAAEMATLKDIGVYGGQGYFLGKPAHVPDLCRVYDRRAQVA